MSTLYAILANMILAVHVAIVWFVILGLAVTILGGVLGWTWVRNFWFRAAHLATIIFVIVQAWCGEICPLTTWEQQLRAAAGQQSYDEPFIAHWLGKLIWVQASPRVLAVIYTVFGLCVVGTFLFVRPRWPHFRRHDPVS